MNRLIAWFDSDHTPPEGLGEQTDWIRLLPFWALHVLALGVFWVGVSPLALGLCVTMYALRMFAITAFYHRYFSHRSFKTNRFWQFVFAVWGATATQRGALWWAAHHRHHHKHSDTSEDRHSPVLRGFWWSHLAWFASHRHFRTNYSRIKDLSSYPELVFLNRFDSLVPALTAAAIYALGAVLESAGWPITAGQALIWGYVVSTLVLFHATATINSLAHLFGSRRFETADNSRNNVWLALLTFGEGWHNNHHHYPHSARQGFQWWEFDLTYYLLHLMRFTGIIHDLKPVPRHLTRSRQRQDTP